MNLCECGICGLEVKPGNKFIKGHARKGKIYKRKILRRCNCGCSGLTKPGCKYIHGHNNRGMEFSKDHRRSISEAIKLKHREPGYTEKIASASRGLIRSNETRRKLSESHKGQIPWHKGKSDVYSEEAIIKMRKAKQGIKLTEEHILKISINKMKCRTDGYCDAWSDKEYKEDLREERCGNCNMNEEESLVSYSQRLHLHHKDGDKSNCHPDNFDTLCVSCHAIADWQIRKEINNGA